jgi:C1A family cysteine protease
MSHSFPTRRSSDLIIPKYEKIDSNTDIIEVVDSNKPVVLGILVFSDFLLVNKDNPMVPMPKDSDIDVGGHAVSIVGYNLDTRQFLIKNSYGSTWGDDGYGWLPFEYVDLYSFENWYFDIPDLTSTVLVDQALSA